ncbi:MAG TPA: efflux RND transporter periplasmic adaptor subunit [Victivallales bacterium]|nr:efflux RND transporter periplasmic adaptor subunit [Victivallales bacterium]
MQNNPFLKYKCLYLLISVMLVFVVSCDNKMKMPEKEIKRVKVAKAIVQDIPVYVDTFGYLTSEHNVNIVSQVTGELTQIHYEEGDHVKKGDILYTIYKAPYEALLNKAKASLKSLESEKKYQAYVVSKDRIPARTGAIALQDFLKYLTQLAVLESKIELTKSEIWQYQIDLNWCDIRSPIDGVTGKKMIDVGNVVSSDDEQAILVNVKSLDPLFIDFTIPEKNLYNLKRSFKKGEQKIVLETEQFGVSEDNPQKVHIGYLQLYDNYVNNETGSISLRGTVRNPNMLLWPGQYVKVRLILFTKKNQLLVPFRSVKQGLKGYYLYIIRNNKAIVKWVKSGQRESEWIVIENKDDFIKPGDNIVTVGIHNLQPGDNVKILKKTSQFLPLKIPEYYFNDDLTLDKKQKRSKKNTGKKK